MIPEIPLLYEDEHLLAINKPSGLLSTQDRIQPQLPNAFHILQKQYNALYIVHRLDKDTSGVMLFSKTKENHKYLSGLFEKRNITKTYAGIVQNNIPQTHIHIDTPLLENPTKAGTMKTDRKGKKSHTLLEVQERFAHYTFVKFTLITGRTHQIRVHSRHIGYPIVGDTLYGNGHKIFLSRLKTGYKLKKGTTEKPLLDKLALHAHMLCFPYETNQITITAPLPKYFQAVLRQLKKHDT